MKTVFLNACLKAIKNNDSNINDEKLDEIRYGLEGLYLTITKIVVISVITLIFCIFKEMIIMLFVFNILRKTGFGIHAKKSWQCWISSLTIFVILPYIAKQIIIPFFVKIILGIISIIAMILYAPADTVKRPLINKKKRLIWKALSVFNCLTLITISFYIKDNTISNLLLFGILIEVVLINPITYMVFKMPYNNYKTYGLNSNV